MRKGRARKAGRPPRGQSKRSDERRITHLLNHSVRLEAFLATFEAKTSPSEVAKLLRKPLSDVSFHMSELRKEGVIEMVKGVQRRGAVEHFYRATQPPEIDAEGWRATPLSARRKIAALGLQVVIADALCALRHKKFEEDEDMYLVWMPMRLTPEGQSKVTGLQAEMMERMIAIKGEHEIPEGEESDQPMKVAVSLWFQRGIPGLRRPRGTPEIEDLGTD